MAKTTQDGRGFKGTILVEVDGTFEGTDEELKEFIRKNPPLLELGGAGWRDGEVQGYRIKAGSILEIQSLERDEC